MPPDPGSGQPRRIGIEKIHGYAGSQVLSMEELAEARGLNPSTMWDDLLVRARSVNPLWEDPVTMAVNAAKPMLDEQDLEQIELVIVGTESSVDQGKAMSTYAQNFLGIQPNCRVYESKQACYSGTSAVMMAAHWIASGLSAGKKALVICTDQSRMHLGAPYEVVMGAGAVAMLISDDPRVLELELEHNGYWTHDVCDTFRPTSKVETGNNEVSLYAYIDALEGAYAHYLSKTGEIDFDTRFKKHIYHVPFGGITFQAHRTLLRQWKRMKKSEAWAHFERKSLPGLRYNCQLGGTYSGSTFLALMGMIDSCDDLEPGDRVSIFSYGSGSCGEFYGGIIGAGAREVVAAAGMQELVDQRRPISVKEYEALEQARFDLIDRGTYEIPLDGLDGLYEKSFAGKGLLTLRGNKEHYRHYDWS